MDAKTFFDNFGLIASAPNGTEQLRSMILQLAVQGKLSINIDADTSADKTLGQIQIYKQRLLGRGDIRPVLGATDTPALKKDLPKNWQSTTINSIAWPQAGFSFKSTNFNKLKQGVPLIRIRDISKKDTEVYYSGEYKDDFLVKTGDYLIAMDGNFNITRWQGSTALLNQRVTRLVFFDEGEVNRAFIFIVLQLALQELQGEVSYTTVDHLSTKQIANITIHLPPKEEQDRIVSIIEHLYGICDHLEALDKKVHDLHLRNFAFFDALISANGEIEKTNAWMRIVNNFSLLVRTTNFQKIKDSLDSLGLQGKLTATNTEDEALYLNMLKDQTYDSKEFYIEKKWMRRNSSVAPRFIVDHKFPQTWPIPALDDIAIVMGGVTKGRNLGDKETSMFPYLRVANVQRGSLDLRDIQEIEIATNEYEKYSLANNDLLVAEGGDWDKVGRAALWNNQISNCIHQNHIFKIRVVSKLLLPEWLEFIFNSPYGKAYFSTASKKTTNLASINMTQVRSFPCPVPPVSEQKTILSLISGIKALLDRLHLQQENKSKKSTRLATELIKAITGMDILKKEIMKAPKTEIITELSTKQAPLDGDEAPLYTLLQKEGGKLTAKALWQASDFDDINQFYQKLLKEIGKGWIEQGEVSVQVEKTEDNA